MSLARAELLRIGMHEPLPSLLERAAQLRDRGHGNRITYSRKVFIPLTQLCRDACGYCTFARPALPGKRAFLTPEEVLDIARAGERAGCHEALLTLGDKPELRWAQARAELQSLGHATTLDYVERICALILRETSLLPHVNAGVMEREDIVRLRAVSVSQGLMLESAAERLCEPGGPHAAAPDKVPAVRLATIRAAGDARVPFTSGILIGIGETREERLDALLALRALHEEFGHLQEVIVQNFRAKAATPMARASEPDTVELAWTIAMARHVFGPSMHIQAPPNLTPDDYVDLVAAGIDDWGGISPVTPDHVNPEAPWPHIEALRARTAEAGKVLTARLAAYPEFCSPEWQDRAVVPHLLRAGDADGLARTDRWTAGSGQPIPADGRGIPSSVRVPPGERLRSLLARASDGQALREDEIEVLFAVRGNDVDLVCRAADDLRHAVCGDTVSYVVNRNLNYTNVCAHKCRFCAFSRGHHDDLRGSPYDLELAEVGRRVREAWQRGATEVCMQGGIHPDYSGETYLALLRAAKEAAPDIHVHAFSPLEIAHGARTLGIDPTRFLARLHDAGLGTLPGTAAEILCDDVRAVICPDKIDSATWLRIVEQAHRVGLRTTATMMFGHVDQPRHWAVHIARIRALQARTGGFTEFVPLPFVHMEAPLYRQGRARPGPTFREVLLVHAIARLALHPLIPNIQVSWVKLGEQGARACLDAGANDLGGTLMNESISHAAGTVHAQEYPAAAMEALIASAGRTARQRTTLYGDVGEERRRAAARAGELEPLVLTPATKLARVGSVRQSLAGVARGADH